MTEEFEKNQIEFIKTLHSITLDISEFLTSVALGNKNYNEEKAERLYRVHKSFKEG